MGIKSAVRMAQNVMESKHTRHISIRMHLVMNGEECNFHRTVWYKGGLQLTDNGTNSVREDELNHRLVYDMVILDN